MPLSTTISVSRYRKVKPHTPFVIAQQNENKDNPTTITFAAGLTGQVYFWASSQVRPGPLEVYKRTFGENNTFGDW